ncbi:MAG: sigma-70 family RNA polymerase sigma factor [Deltaproteobacteria bacterium]|nr:sigma-70 family RNA polymerase sigma factor [Deltaproteobacteria bacterium]MBW2658147.1 sigma-70 family RNA polymerase sigma factor [Deltaproteobacteria bacterium]
MVALRRVDKKRFKELTYPHLEFLYNVALKYSGNKYDAEDLVQETMVTGYTKFQQLRDEKSCRAWLFTILRNHFLRERKQFLKRPYLDDGSSYLDYISDEKSSGFVDRLIEKDANKELHRVLATISEKFQSPLILYYMEEMTYQEISKYLDIPIGTVMSRLARGKRHLKKGLLKSSGRKKSAGKIIQMMNLIMLH